jgi:hypothetical protein
MFMFIVVALVVVAGAVAVTGCGLVLGGETARNTLRRVVGNARFAIAENKGGLNVSRLRVIGLLMLTFDTVFVWAAIRSFMK